MPSSIGRMPGSSLLARSRKERPSFEILCELVYRPLANFVVAVLLPLRTPPPAVVLASAATGVFGAVEIGQRARQLQNAMIAPRGQTQTLGRLAHQRGPRPVQRGDRLDDIGGRGRVAGDARQAH